MDSLARTFTFTKTSQMLAFGSALAALTLALMTTVSPASADAPGTDPTFSFDQTFEYTGDQQIIDFEPGVNAVDAVAIGGSGASMAGRPGGLGAKVTGRLTVGPERRFFVLVGGDGGTNPVGAQIGGFNGGGDGSKPSWTGVRGGGGGGASDVRTIDSTYLDTLASRLLVAGGGGGAGGNSDHGGWLGGVGGNAEQSGARGQNATPQNGLGSGGYGGAPGTALAGGAGGQGGWNYGGGGQDGYAGDNGTLGQGGDGGPGATNTGTSMGAGGGGGLYGGGGGGGGLYHVFNGTEYFSGGGGGGGGSSLVPEGGVSELASPEDEPSIEISYTVPGTSILSGPVPVTRSTEAELSFESSEAGSTFECQVDDAEEFTACKSPVTLTDLSEGPHLFRVRAVNEMGNVDQTPAERSFTVDTSPPEVRIDSGPTGKTTDRRPEFTFSSEAGATFQCRFDQEAFGACSGSASDRPATDLSPGAHTFAVKATDPAGNTGPESTRAFQVEAGDPPPPPPGRATLQLKKPKFKRAKGIAVLPARVSGPGEVVLLKSRKVKASKRSPGKAKTVKLKVRARGKALKKLRRRGKVTVKIRVRFTPRAGSPVTKSKRLTLRKRR